MAMKLTQYKLTCTVDAGETTASVQSTKPIRGSIKAIYVQFNNTTPASSSDRDVDIREMNPIDDDDTNDALQHILDVGGIGADPESDNAIYYPRTYAQDYQGTDLTYDATRKIPTEFLVFGKKLQLNVSAAAEGDITTAYIVVEEY